MTPRTAGAQAVRGGGLYVYCVAPGRVNWLLGPIGLDGKMVYSVPGAGLCCLVHNCTARPYQSDDRQTVYAWVKAHQRAVEAGFDAFGAVLPMAFNMIVQDANGRAATENLKAWMAQNREKFLQRLDRLAGKAEYAVQILWDRRIATEALVRTDPALSRMQHEARSRPKGAAYMLRQQLAKATRAALEDRANRLVQESYDKIRQSVDDVRVEKLRKLPGDEQTLLSLACLADKGGDALGAVLNEIQATRGLSVRFTGPWPPYSFAAAG